MAMIKKIANIINLFAQIFILAIIFILPIYFALFLKTNDAFELNKLVVFKILVLLLLFFSGLKFIFFARLDFKNFIRAKYFLGALFFLLIFALSTVLSINLDASLYGAYGKFQGLSSYLYLILFFILFNLNINHKAQIKRVIWALVLSSVLVCFYGLIQASGHDPVSWTESTQIRATATFGQPNHVGAYLLFAIPLSFYLLISCKKLLIKLGILLIILAQILTLIFTHSLSAWVGILGTLFLTAIIIIFTRPGILLGAGKYLKLGLAVIVLLAITGAIFLNFSSSNTISYKLINLFNPQSGSTAARVQFWRAAAEAIAERPVFGYGPDTQQEILTRYYNQDWAVYSNVNVRPARAHNLWLDILLIQGILGLALWLAVLFLFYYYLIKNIRANKEKALKQANIA